MATVRASAWRRISAPASRVYAILADYNQQHPRILPSAFSEWRVEEGGTGAGTIVSFGIKAGGRNRRYRMRVEEPQPGRVLTETDLDSSLVTTFTVVPEGEAACRVRIETVWQGAGGGGGFFERLFAPRVLQRLYTEELSNLDRAAREQATSGAPLNR